MIYQNLKKTVTQIVNTTKYNFWKIKYKINKSQKLNYKRNKLKILAKLVKFRKMYNAKIFYNNINKKIIMIFKKTVKVTIYNNNNLLKILNY